MTSRMASTKNASFIGKPIRPQTSTYRGNPVTKDLTAGVESRNLTDLPIDLAAIRISHEAKLEELAQLAQVNKSEMRAI